MTFQECIKRSMKNQFSNMHASKNNGIQFFTNGFSGLRIPSLEKKIIVSQLLAVTSKPVIKNKLRHPFSKIRKFYEAIVPIFLKENLAFGFAMQKRLCF
jgi:hypothetical protein